MLSLKFYRERVDFGYKTRVSCAGRPAALITSDLSASCNSVSVYLSIEWISTGKTRKTDKTKGARELSFLLFFGQKMRLVLPLSISFVFVVAVVVESSYRIFPESEERKAPSDISRRYGKLVTTGARMWKRYARARYYSRVYYVGYKLLASRSRGVDSRRNANRSAVRDVTPDRPLSVR